VLTTQYSENGSGYPVLEPVPTSNHYWQNVDSSVVE